MCGIAGIVDFRTAQPQEDLLRRMLGLIRHRGPDAFGIYMVPIGSIKISKT